MAKTKPKKEEHPIVPSLRLFAQWLRHSDSTRVMMWHAPHRCWEIAEPDELLKAYLKHQKII